MANTYDSTKDPYAQRSTSVGSPARGAVAVTPSNTVDLTVYAKSLYIGGTGDVTVLPVNALDDANIVVFKNHPVGYLPMQVRRVLSTGTTATFITALLN